MARAPLTLLLTLIALPGVGLGDPYRHDPYARGRAFDEPVEYARVVDVEPLYRTVRVEAPREVCREVVRYAPDRHGPDLEPAYRDDGARRVYRHDRVLPTISSRVVAGGVVGGAVGRQFGGGSGRDAMTVLGAIVGAAFANELAAGRRDERRAYDHFDHPRERYDRYGDARRSDPGGVRCEVRYEPRSERRIDGYRVTYVYRGREFTTRTARHPGRRIAVDVGVTPIR